MNDPGKERIQAGDGPGCVRLAEPGPEGFIGPFALAGMPWVVLPAIGIALWPGALDALAWDRRALLAGQAWRWFTGHWVHFSPGHLLADAIALLAASACLRPGDQAALWKALALSLCAIPGVILLLDPATARYGGLSGLAMAAWALAATRLCQARGPARLVGAGLASGCAAKIVLEWASGSAMWGQAMGNAVPCIPAHLAGVACGVVVALRPSAATPRAVPCAAAQRRMATPRGFGDRMPPCSAFHGDA